MQHYGPNLVKAIDKDVPIREARKKGRTHLGASVLGRKCLRQIWYGWRWAHVTQHSGRILRLFNRGHREEPKFVELLQNVGITVRSHAERLCYHDGSDSYVSYPWDAEYPAAEVDDVSDDAVHIGRATSRGQGPKQLNFADHDGHFGGSGDGMVHGLSVVWPDFALEGPGLAEYKTHGEKSFIDIAGKLEDWRKHVTDPVKNPFTGKGLLSSKIEHYVQMHVYMKYFGLKWGMYVAVCKNTDDLYIEFIQYKPELAEAYADRAKQIIYAKAPPPRITQDPSWWECKFCDYREICHRGEFMAKNCRSCVFAEPTADGTWTCNNFNQVIPKDFMPKGCDAWEQLPA